MSSHELGGARLFAGYRQIWSLSENRAAGEPHFHLSTLGFSILEETEDGQSGWLFAPLRLPLTMRPTASLRARWSRHFFLGSEEVRGAPKIPLESNDGDTDTFFKPASWT